MFLLFSYLFCDSLSRDYYVQEIERINLSKLTKIQTKPDEWQNLTDLMLPDNISLRSVIARLIYSHLAKRVLEINKNIY